MPLYSMTVADGAITSVGGNLKEIVSLAYKPTGPVLWGLSKNNGGALYTINVATGAATRVGSGGGLGNMQNIFYAADDDILYGYSPLDGGSIYTINQSTGAPTLLVNRGINGLGGFSLCAYVDGGVAIFYNGNVAVVDIIATGELLVSEASASDLLAIEFDSVLDATYVLYPKHLQRDNSDDSSDIIATAGLGTMRAMTFTTNADGILYFVG